MTRARREIAVKPVLRGPPVRRDPLARRGLGGTKAIAVRQAHRVPRGTLERRAPPGRRGPRARPGHRVKRAPLDRRAFRVCRASPVPVERKAQKATMA